MAVPATTGVLRTKIEEMEIGDYIICKYVATANAVGTFSEIGTSTATEIAVAGSNVPNGAFYFMKLAKGLLVADRVVQHTFSWDAMNTGKIIQGKPTTLGVTNGNIRSLTGGVAYADANGNSSTTGKGFGAFPTNNEWDKYIVNFPVEMTQSGKTLDDVFHWKNIYTFTQDTPSVLIQVNITRVLRGEASRDKWTSVNSAVPDFTFGFRPVFEYREA